jgi:hypothetical protein
VASLLTWQRILLQVLFGAETELGNNPVNDLPALPSRSGFLRSELRNWLRCCERRVLSCEMISWMIVVTCSPSARRVLVPSPACGVAPA